MSFNFVLVVFFTAMHRLGVMCEKSNILPESEPILLTFEPSFRDIQEQFKQSRLKIITILLPISTAAST